MNQFSSRFSSVCGSSSRSLFRKNLFTRWSSSSNPVSFSKLISNNNPSSSSNLITPFISEFHHHTVNYPPPLSQIPGNHHVRKFSGEASECDLQDDVYLKNEIWQVQAEQIHTLWIMKRECLPPLEAVNNLAVKFNALMEKLGINYNEKSGDFYDYPHHLEIFREMIQDLAESVDMTVAYGEFVASGGEIFWEAFMSHYQRMLRGEACEEYRKILASLRKMKIRSRLMRRLIEAKSDSRSAVAA